jgi:hypothetical protein
MSADIARVVVVVVVEDSSALVAVKRELGSLMQNPERYPWLFIRKDVLSKASFESGVVQGE